MKLALLELEGAESTATRKVLMRRVCYWLCGLHPGARRGSTAATGDSNCCITQRRTPR